MSLTWRMKEDNIFHCKVPGLNSFQAVNNQAHEQGPGQKRPGFHCQEGASNMRISWESFLFASRRKVDLNEKMNRWVDPKNQNWHLHKIQVLRAREKLAVTPRKGTITKSNDGGGLVIEHVFARQRDRFREAPFLKAVKKHMLCTF